MAYTLNGTTQDLSVGSVPIGGTPFTMAIWVNTDWTAAMAGTVLFVTDTTTGHYHALSVTSAVAPTNDSFQAQTKAGTKTGTATLALSLSTTDLWVLVVGRFISSTSRNVRVRGSQASNTTTANATVGDKTVVGSANGSSFWGAKVAEAMFWNTDITDAQIDAMAGLEYAPNWSGGREPRQVRPKNLVAHWHLLNGYLYDSLTGGLLAANNSPTIVDGPHITRGRNIVRQGTTRARPLVVA